MKWMRVVCAAVLVASLPVSTAVDAQQAAKVHRIGMLGNDYTPPWDGLLLGLRDLGHVEGRNVAFEWRWSRGSTEDFPALARELVALQPDVIVTSGTQAARAAADATQSVPIVMALSHYPVELGLVESLARPGRNVTGLNTFGPELTAKKLELLREIAPGTSRLAVLWSPANPAEQIQYQDLLAAARAAGIAVQSIELTHPSDLSAAFAAIRASSADALMAIANPITFRNRQQIADFALAHRLPGLFEASLFVEAGGLISYSPSFTAQFRDAARYVDRILKGAKPADLPVERPTEFELAINRKTARALRIEIPASLLLRAGQLVE